MPLIAIKISGFRINQSNNYYNLGLCYENLKQYDDAIHAYQEAISIKPDYINVTPIWEFFTINRINPKKP